MGKAELIADIMNTVNEWPHDKQVNFLIFLKQLKKEQEAMAAQ